MLIVVDVDPRVDEHEHMSTHIKIYQNMYVCMHVYVSVRTRAADPTYSASQIDSGIIVWPDFAKMKCIGYVLDVLDIYCIYSIYCTYRKHTS